jgi:hypothetical protein
MILEICKEGLKAGTTLAVKGFLVFFYQLVECTWLRKYRRLSTMQSSLYAASWSREIAHQNHYWLTYQHFYLASTNTFQETYKIVLENKRK